MVRYKSVLDLLTNKSTINGAIPEPTRAHIDEAPTAIFLTLVGTNSADIKNTTLNAGDMNNFPIVFNVRFNHTISEK